MDLSASVLHVINTTIKSNPGRKGRISADGREGKSVGIQAGSEVQAISECCLYWLAYHGLPNLGTQGLLQSSHSLSQGIARPHSSKLYTENITSPLTGAWATCMGCLLTLECRARDRAVYTLQVACWCGVCQEV